MYYDPKIILISGILLSLFFFLLGIPVRYFNQYWIIAGYNQASSEDKEKYDIEGLAKHLGNGLIVIGCLIIMISISLFYDHFLISLVLMVGIIIIPFMMVIGGQKFLPRFLFPPPGKEKYLKHRFLQFFLPKNIFVRVKKGTQQWCIVCPCGQKNDFWSVGGVRFKAIGEKRQIYFCLSCRKMRWHTLKKLI